MRSSEIFLLSSGNPAICQTFAGIMSHHHHFLQVQTLSCCNRISILLSFVAFSSSYKLSAFYVILAEQEELMWKKDKADCFAGRNFWLLIDSVIVSHNSSA